MVKTQLMKEVAKGLPVVAIDGPAGAGKSAVSKRLTLALGYQLLDTGALYRSIAYLAQKGGIDWQDEQGLAEIAAKLEVDFRLDGEINHLHVGGEDLTELIRSPEISVGASIVSRHPMVRTALLQLQRDLASSGGVVAEGRDVGTVVFPNADAKFFLTASDEVRAQRRYDELISKGVETDFESTLKEMLERDERDTGRELAPLIQAEDAILVDSSNTGVDEVVAQMLAHVRQVEAAL
ncbi:MAG: (d)CMP kinase [Kofleriaceae bacterium]|nr:(d)CMP kinase [Kofleriaceae bacterium]